VTSLILKRGVRYTSSTLFRAYDQLHFKFSLCSLDVFVVVIVLLGIGFSFSSKPINWLGRMQGVVQRKGMGQEKARESPSAQV